MYFVFRFYCVCLCVKHVCLNFRIWSVIKKLLFLCETVRCHDLWPTLKVNTFHAGKYFLLFLLLWLWLSDSLFFPGIDDLSHPSPALPTDSNFDSLFQQFTTFIFSSEVNGGQVITAEHIAFSGYQVCLWIEIVITFFITQAIRWCKFTFCWGLSLEEHRCSSIFTAERKEVSNYCPISNACQYVYAIYLE